MNMKSEFREAELWESVVWYKDSKTAIIRNEKMYTDDDISRVLTDMKLSGNLDGIYIGSAVGDAGHMSNIKNIAALANEHSLLSSVSVVTSGFSLSNYTGSLESQVQSALSTPANSVAIFDTLSENDLNSYSISPESYSQKLSNLAIKINESGKSAYLYLVNNTADAISEISDYKVGHISKLTYESGARGIFLAIDMREI